MKKFLLFGLVMIVMASFLGANTAITLKGNTNGAKLLFNSNSEMEAKIEFKEINSFNVKTKEGVFSEIALKDAYFGGEIGSPKLPVVKKLIKVPFGANVSVSVLNYDVEEYKLSDFGIDNPIIPNQPSLPKNVDPTTVKFIYNKDAYNVSGYKKNANIATVEVLGTLRAARIARLVINPVEYNPTEGKIRIYNNIDVKVTFSGADLAREDYVNKSTYSPYFEPVYKKLFNYRDRDHDYPDHPDHTTYPIKYLIIADRMFEAQLQEFIQWKTEKGFNVITAYTDEIGSSTNAIQTYIHDQYNAGTPEDPAPTFCLLVGDVQQVPASATGSATSRKTDLYYFSVDGDYFPEMYYGRFSATNTSELQPQIDKTLYYERYEFADPSYLDNVTLIAGSDGTWNPRVGQPTIEYGTQNYFNTEHGFSTINEYLTSYSGCYDTINDGVGFINYTAHGSETSWADPQFNVSNVHSLTNDGKYPLAIGNCCLSGDFGYSECYGEAWLRGNHKGAIGYIGSSPSSYWFEDFYWGVGAFPISGTNDGYVPTYDETTWGAYDGVFVTDYHANDAVVFIGNLAVTEVDIQGFPQHSSPLYYWQAYNLLGDPSVVTYLTQGSDNDVSYMDVLPIGTSSFDVTAEPGSYVAISFAGELKGTALVGESGTVSVPIIPITQSGNAKIVVTKPQYKPYVEEVLVAPLEGPYVVIDNYTVSTTDGDNVVEFGENGNLNIDFKNVGTTVATNVNVVISTDDPYITITDNSEAIGNLNPNQVVSFANAFAFTVANNVPDNHSVSFDVSITGNSDQQWETNINLTAYAPVLELTNVVIDDGENGRLDPGETADMVVYFTNNGGATVSNLNFLLSSNDSFITINSNSSVYALIEAGETGNATFNVTANANTEPGHSVGFAVAASADNDYTYNGTFNVSVGLNLEDFESGDFSSYPWEFNGIADWSISNTAYEGSYAAQSGDINDSQESGLEVTLDVMNDGQISFYYKVSSEANYDYLKFYIDGSEIASWAGETDWTQASFDVSSGTRTFKWQYEKDGSVSNGEDCGWIDYIIFPSAGTSEPTDFVVTPEELTVSLAQNGSAQRTLTLANNGGGTVNYTLSIYGTDGSKNLTGSNIICNATEYSPGETVDWTFTVNCSSDDNEWLKDVWIVFPTGITVNSSTPITGGSGGDIPSDNATGDGATIHWGGSGYMADGETATATVSITADGGLADDANLAWTIHGDEWGDDPHEITGNIVIPVGGEPITWISLSETSGSVSDHSSNDVTVYFNSNDLEWGNIYTCEIRITDDRGRDLTTIPVTLYYNGQDGNNNNQIPLVTKLSGNYPNPFNPETTIAYEINKNCPVRIDIYNVKGQHVKTLVNENQQAGYYKQIWNGKDNSGKKVSSGVYFYKLHAGNTYTYTKKMILMK